ncbi:HIT family protein [Paenibacillus glacialis]|uniref:Cell-cycle regulation histidine triad HIT protein n=1 Tax=Paenibacillus glacialis TaxID=494026 RepID=A0A169ZFX4_9BACL|nr:HIT domain-containing protein [Paenibacillus glacialis]OAB39768.1 cell-cycle regulation histidine triad HIT protein [Paenibacillus glacialis]
MTHHDHCVFCSPEQETRQREILSNESCIFYQMPQEILIGSGLIVPRLHRVNVFELTDKEWHDTFTLVKQVKEHLDELHNPDGYNLQWNTDGAAGQHLFHSHLHIIPRFKNEPLVGIDLRSFLGKDDNKRPFSSN